MTASRQFLQAVDKTAQTLCNAMTPTATPAERYWLRSDHRRCCLQLHSLLQQNEKCTRPPAPSTSLPQPICTCRSRHPSPQLCHYFLYGKRISALFCRLNYGQAFDIVAYSYWWSTGGRCTETKRASLAFINERPLRTTMYTEATTVGYNQCYLTPKPFRQLILAKILYNVHFEDGNDAR